MIGAIAGDMIGSVYEGSPIKRTNFTLFHPQCCFTDDTVLTVAVADCIMSGESFTTKFHEYFHAYPHAGYGGTFIQWAFHRQSEPYNSWGNGSAMRVSPVGFAYDSLDEVLDQAKHSAEVTHNHPEGIRGAQATAATIFWARTRKDKEYIRSSVEHRFGYDLSQRLEDIRPGYTFDISCQGSVPQSIIAFLESRTYEEAVRNAISLGGDADTMACIAGGIAEAYYGGIPKTIEEWTLGLLDERLRRVAEEFRRRFVLQAG